jgi:hypothetical protein
MLSAVVSLHVKRIQYTLHFVVVGGGLGDFIEVVE